MKSKIGIIAAVGCALALCIACVGCAPADPKANYVGSWELESSTQDGLDENAIELMKSYGLFMTLDLNEDGTGTMGMFGEDMDVEWSVADSAQGEISIAGGEKSKISYSEGKLVIDDEGSKTQMTFAKATASSASAASSSAESASAEAASSEAASSASAASSSAESTSAEAASSEAASSASAASDSASSAASSKAA